VGRARPPRAAPTEWGTTWAPIDRWFQELGGFPLLAHPSRWTAWTWDVEGGNLPRADVVDTGDHLEVRVELPGVSKESIEVRVQGDTLRIAARSAEESSDTSGTYLLKERRSRSFERAFQLSEAIPASKLSAKFENGVLTVSVPKPTPPVDEKVPVA
jgi:HSP20 family protein